MYDDNNNNNNNNADVKIKISPPAAPTAGLTLGWGTRLRSDYYFSLPFAKAHNENQCESIDTAIDLQEKAIVD